MPDARSAPIADGGMSNAALSDGQATPKTVSGKPSDTNARYESARTTSPGLPMCIEAILHRTARENAWAPGAWLQVRPFVCATVELDPRCGKLACRRTARSARGARGARGARYRGSPRA